MTSVCAKTSTANYQKSAIAVMAALATVGASAVVVSPIHSGSPPGATTVQVRPTTAESAFQTAVSQFEQAAANAANPAMWVADIGKIVAAVGTDLNTFVGSVAFHTIMQPIIWPAMLITENLQGMIQEPSIIPGVLQNYFTTLIAAVGGGVTGVVQDVVTLVKSLLSLGSVIVTPAAALKPAATSNVVANAAAITPSSIITQIVDFVNSALNAALNTFQVVRTNADLGLIAVDGELYRGARTVGTTVTNSLTKLLGPVAGAQPVKAVLTAVNTFFENVVVPPNSLEGLSGAFGLPPLAIPINLFRMATAPVNALSLAVQAFVASLQGKSATSSAAVKNSIAAVPKTNPKNTTLTLKPLASTPDNSKPVGKTTKSNKPVKADTSDAKTDSKANGSKGSHDTHAPRHPAAGTGHAGGHGSK
jgi:hypothetical protein